MQEGSEGLPLTRFAVQVAIVTGGNDGIGFITARELHKKGCKVYLACRNEEKAQDAIKRINEASPGKPEGLVFLPFDLTELKSAEKAAKTVQEKEQRLDIIVCNAGEYGGPCLLLSTSRFCPLLRFEADFMLSQESWRGRTSSRTASSASSGTTSATLRSSSRSSRSSSRRRRSLVRRLGS